MLHEIDQQRVLNNNSVRQRIREGGDAWAEQHRRNLPKECYFQDIDGMLGITSFYSSTADKCFVEYEPDDYANRGKTIRSFGVVGMFDRKSTESAVLYDRNVLTRSLYLWQCRVFADHQGIAPKFFYVIGESKSPWLMMELDINTGDKVNEFLLEDQSWAEMWEAVGLMDLRNQIHAWLASSATGKL